MLNVGLFCCRMHQRTNNSCSVLFVFAFFFFWLVQVKIDEVALEKADSELPAGVNLQIAWNNSSSMFKTLLPFDANLELRKKAQVMSTLNF